MSNKKFAAVIVETRNLPNLKEIIVDNHLRYLPENWDCIIFCSEANKDKFDFLPESKSKTSVLIDDNENLSQAEYNKILTSTWFWEQLTWYDKVLIFQHDSKLLRTGIEEFLEWDMVGAPWTFQEHGSNGGLSLRSPNIMLKICQDWEYNYPQSGNEDLWFSNIMAAPISGLRLPASRLGFGKLAPREVCEKFSCEAIFKLGTLGYHAIDKYLTKEECEQIENQYKVNTGKSETAKPEESHRHIDKPEKGSLGDLGITGQEGIARTYLDEEEKSKEVKETTILEKIYSEMCETKKLLQLLVRKEKQASLKELFEDEGELVVNIPTKTNTASVVATSEKPSQEIIDKAKAEILLRYKQAFEKPTDINEHLPTLRKYAEGLEVIEMGTRDVVSSWAFLDSAKKLICYDILKHQNVDALMILAKQADKDFEFIENDVLKVTIPECDLLFIDTLHIYGQLKEELRIHGNKARKYLVFHDCVSYGFTNENINSDWLPEVVKANYKVTDKQGLMPAIMEFMEENKHWGIAENFTNNNGLLILKRS